LIIRFEANKLLALIVSSLINSNNLRNIRTTFYD